MHRVLLLLVPRRGLATAYKYSPKRESTFVRVWVKQGKAAWPLVGIFGLFIAFVATFAVHSLNNPLIHLNRAERRSLDRILDDQATDDKRVTSWTESVFHRGPAMLLQRKKAEEEQENNARAPAGSQPSFMNSVDSTATATPAVAVAAAASSPSSAGVV